jgi:hypothetical protein
VEGTLAKHILTEPETISTMNGGKIALRMSVSYISFSAHADFTETAEFIDLLKPPHIILVHGDASEGVGRMRYALEARFKDEQPAIKIVAPRNCQTVQLQFRAQKVAKTVGSLAAAGPPVQGQLLSGLLVRKNFIDYTLIRPDELSQFTSLHSTTVQQEIKVPFHQTFECLRYFVAQMYELDDDEDDEDDQQFDGKDEPTVKDEKKSDDDGDAGKASAASTTKKSAAASSADSSMADTEEAASSTRAAAADDASAPRIRVHGSVTLSYHTQPSPHVLVRWSSTPVADMLSDSLLALMANIQSNPGMARVIGAAGGCRNARATGHTHKHGKCEHGGHAHEEHAGAAVAASAAAAAPAAAAAANGAEAEAKPAFAGSSADAAYFSASLKKPAAAAPGRPSFMWFLQQHYGPDIAYSPDEDSYRFTLNEVDCVVRGRSLEVECADAELRGRIRAMVRRAHAACNPISAINSKPVDEAEEERKQIAVANAAATAAAAKAAATTPAASGNATAADASKAV